MMQRPFIRALWACLLGLGVMAGLARAQEIQVPAAGPPPDPGMGFLHGVPEGIVPHRPPGSILGNPDPAPWPLHPIGQPSYARRRIWRMSSVGCWAHHINPRCGSLSSELRFCFGSCRAFYGEPCLKEAPQVTLPAGVDLEPTVLIKGDKNKNKTMGGKNGGCGCGP